MIVLRGTDALYTAATCPAPRTWFSQLCVCGPEPAGPADAPVATAIQRVYDPLAMKERMFQPSAGVVPTEAAATTPPTVTETAKDDTLFLVGIGAAALGVLFLLLGK